MGEASYLHALSVTSGEENLVTKRDDVIHAVAFDPQTEAVFLLTLDPKTRRERSIVRFPLSRPDKSESISLATAGPGVASQVWKRLWVTPDGARLVVVDCPDLCKATVLALRDTAPVSPFDIGEGDVVGVTNEAILTVFGCAPPCPATRFDLASGAPEPLGVFCEAGVIASVQGRYSLISDWPTRAGCSDTQYFVGRTDIASGEQVDILLAPDRRRSLVSLDATQGAQLPEGWFMLGPGGRIVGTGDQRMLAPLLVRAVDGSEVQLPPMGPMRDP